MKPTIYILLLSLIFLASCSGSDKNIEFSIIRDILQDIQISFNQRELDKILSYYHPDFLHKGKNIYAITNDWQHYMNTYLELNIEIIDLDIRDYEAIARIKITWKDQNHTYPPYIDPETRGEMSYFYKEHRDWKIIGNGNPE